MLAGLTGELLMVGRGVGDEPGPLSQAACGVQTYQQTTPGMCKT